MSKLYSYPFPNVSTGYCCQLGFPFRVILHSNRLTFLFDGVPSYYSKFDLDVALKVHEEMIQPKDIQSIREFVNEHDKVFKSEEDDKNTFSTGQTSLF